MALIDKLTAIADAIRVQSGKTGKLTLDQMPTEIVDLQSLGFEVVGGTSAPSNPKENTIWVNTSTSITSWVFSATQPTRATGRVWISVGASSSVAFNALKKNNITVYPLSAKQYVSGKWVDKTAKIYQNGAWVDWWDGQLYENGNQFTNVTGGWDIHDYVTNSRPLMAAEHKSDQMFFRAQNNYDVLMGINNPVDLSNVNQIRITGMMNQIFTYNGAVYGMTMKVLKTKDLASKVAEFSMLVKGMFDYTLDVSNLSGKHYLTIQAFPNANINGYITGVYLI